MAINKVNENMICIKHIKHLKLVRNKSIILKELSANLLLQRILIAEVAAKDHLYQAYQVAKPLGIKYLLKKYR